MQVEAFCVKKQTTLGEFKKMMADRWNVSVHKQRLWIFIMRENRSSRPCRPLEDQDNETCVCDLWVGFIMPSSMIAVAVSALWCHIFLALTWLPDILELPAPL